MNLNPVPSFIPSFRMTKQNKKILIITYYWPPSGGPAVQRWLKYSGFLVEAGWEVFVLTVDEKFASFPAIDEKLNELVNKKIHVYKTATKEFFNIYKKTIGRGTIPSSAFANESNPGPLRKIARFIRGNFFIPDARKGWKKFAVPVAEKIILENSISLVITAGPPHSTHFIAMDLKKKYNIKWIADFHDAWTDIIFYKQLYHTTLAKNIDARLERNVLEDCDRIFTVGEIYKEKLLQKTSKISPEKFHILRMGYDEKYFENKNIKTAEHTDFTITYTGTISDNYNPEILFRVIKKILNENKNYKVKLKFIGMLADGIKRKIIEEGLQNILEEKKYIPHEKAIEELFSSDVLLLVNPEIEQQDMVIPGKIYEYLAAERPIINISSLTSETAMIIEDCKAGKTFERTMDGELENYILELYNDYLAPKKINSENKLSKMFSYQQQAISLHNFLQKII